MRRNPVPRRTAVKRRFSAEIPAVPTVSPEPGNPDTGVKRDELLLAAIKEDADDEAVRRMVEAAYT